MQQGKGVLCSSPLTSCTKPQHLLWSCTVANTRAVAALGSPKMSMYSINLEEIHTGILNELLLKVNCKLDFKSKVFFYITSF